MISRNQMSKLPIKKNIDEKLDLIPENKNRIVGDALSQNAADDISKIQPKTEMKPRMTGLPLEKTLKPITKIGIGNNVGNVNGGDTKIVSSVKEMINRKNNSQKINSDSNDNIRFNDIKAVKSTEIPVSMTSLSIGPSSVKNDSSKFNSKIKDRMIARRNSTEKESVPPAPVPNPSPPSSSSAYLNKPLGSMVDSFRNLPKPNMNTDNKSRDNALYLAKNLRPKSINIISTRSSSFRIDTNIPARSVLNRLPTPRTSTNSKEQPVMQTTVQNDVSKNRYSRNISVDSRDGKGYGRKIKIQPKLNKELFLLNRDGIIVSLKKRGLESDIIPENVGNLITKFRDLAPEDYDHMVYMYLYVCMCAGVCVYVCINLCTYKYIYVCIYINIYTYLFIYIYSFMHIHFDVDICICICKYEYIFVCIDICMYINMVVYVYIYEYIYIYMYVYIYIYKYTNICVRKLHTRYVYKYTSSHESLT
jgi:hypothetical protein